MWKTHTLYDYWQLICSRSWLLGALRRRRRGDVGQWLKATDRQAGRGKAVEAQRRRRLVHQLQQRGIHRHVAGAGTLRVHYESELGRGWSGGHRGRG
mgnify:CR=1 FL=1